MNTIPQAHPSGQSGCTADDKQPMDDPPVPGGLPGFDPDADGPYANEEAFEDILDLIHTYNIQPIATHVVAAGSEYGLVKAWSISKYKSKFLIEYHNWNIGGFAFSKNADHLPEWLIGTETDPAEWANLGNKPPKTVAQNHAGPCSVIVAINHDPSSRYYRWVGNSSDGGGFVFPSTAAARDWITRNITQEYYLGEDECRRPDAFVVMPYAYRKPDFSSRIKKDAAGCDGVELLGTENALSRPRGWCLAAVAEGRIRELFPVYSATSLIDAVHDWKKKKQAAGDDGLWLGRITDRAFLRPLCVSDLTDGELKQKGWLLLENDFVELREES